MHLRATQCSCFSVHPNDPPPRDTTSASYAWPAAEGARANVKLAVSIPIESRIIFSMPIEASRNRGIRSCQNAGSPAHGPGFAHAPGSSGTRGKTRISSNQMAVRAFRNQIFGSERFKILKPVRYPPQKNFWGSQDEAAEGGAGPSLERPGGSITPKFWSGHSERTLQENG